MLKNYPWSTSCQILVLYKGRWEGRTCYVSAILSAALLIKKSVCGWHIVEPLFQEKALEQLKVTKGKIVDVRQNMDFVFHTLQIGFFYMDFDLISKSIDKAKK